MFYTVTETLVSPETHMSFTFISHPKKEAMIIWHVYNKNIVKGKKIIYKSGRVWFRENEIIKSLSLIKEQQFSMPFWKMLVTHTGCEKYIVNGACSYVHACTFAVCPYRYR
jgi:hypothetical protein